MCGRGGRRISRRLERRRSRVLFDLLVVGWTVLYYMLGMYIWRLGDSGSYAVLADAKG